MQRQSLRVYVVCLASCNAGYTFGQWFTIDPLRSVWELERRVNAMLKASPKGHAWEWAIHGYDMGGIDAGKYPTLATLVALARLARFYGTSAVASALDHHDNDLPATIAMLKRYQGSFDTLEAWGWTYLESTGALSKVPETLRAHLDVRSWAHLRATTSDFVAIRRAGETHVFCRP